MTQSLPEAIEQLDRRLADARANGGLTEIWDNEIEALIAAMRAKEQSHSPTGDDVERIARIINPTAFEPLEGLEEDDEFWRSRRLNSQVQARQIAMQKAEAIATLSPNGVERQDFSRTTLRHNIEVILREWRDAHPSSLLERIMSAIPRTATQGVSQSAVERAAANDERIDRVARMVEGMKRQVAAGGNDAGLIEACEHVLALATQPASDTGLREALPDIIAEGERLARETPQTNGSYLWTDLVGAIQTGIAEERARHVRAA